MLRISRVLRPSSFNHFIRSISNYIRPTHRCLVTSSTPVHSRIGTTSPSASATHPPSSHPPQQQSFVFPHPHYSMNETMKITRLQITNRGNGIRTNLLIMGPPGSGKSSVAHLLSQKLNLPLYDIDDHHLEQVVWKKSVAQKLKELGDDAFILAEGEAMKQLNKQHTLISLSGSNPLHPESLSEVIKTGVVVYLDICRDDIISRCSAMKIDRIVGQATLGLETVLSRRQLVYENSYDIRILVSQAKLIPGESTSTSISTSTSNQPPYNTHPTPPGTIKQYASIESIADAIIEQLSHSQAFVSTRGIKTDETGHTLQFLDVVRRGLAPDRGLYIPQQYIPFREGQLARLIPLNYQERLLRVMERFPIGTLHPSILRDMIYAAYSSFTHPQGLVLPITHLQHNQYLMETFHGPTASFKDLSLQLTPKILTYALYENNKNKGVNERVGLIAATSGDTGTAALDGFLREKDVPVIVLYPKDGVSIVQKRQMVTAKGNVCVIGVDGDFDFCQNLVKDILSDKALNTEISRLVPNLVISSANSINWGRFAPQINFTVSAYCDLVAQGTLPFDSSFDVCIPTGNFGNILGAVYARKMGVPIRRLICASNDNNVLYDFIQTGTYDLRKRSFRKTISPSIDILVSSNLERFLYLITDGDHVLVSQLFTQLAKEQHFSIPAPLLKLVQEHMTAVWTSEEDCLTTIKKTFDDTKILIDPHTAVAVHAVNKLGLGKDNVPVVISSTAHFAKFPDSMLKALNIPFKPYTPGTDEGAYMEELLGQLSALKPRNSFHPSIAALTKAPVQSTIICPADKQVVIGHIKEFFQRFAKQTQSKL